VSALTNLYDTAARLWRENCERTPDVRDGFNPDCFVVFFDGKIAGATSWPTPAQWRPGAIAVSPWGDLFEASGGNEKDGAQQWTAFHAGMEENKSAAE
jgi:hypothetical protein